MIKVITADLTRYLLATYLLLAVARQATAQTDIYILAGQSNMMGIAPLSGCEPTPQNQGAAHDVIPAPENGFRPELNPALFDPLARIENACRRASNIMLTAVDPLRESKRLRNYWWYADAFGK